MTPSPYRARVLRRPPSTVTITARQAEVLDGIADGLSNQQIADRMFVSEDTVKTHVKRVLAAVRANNRAHALGLVLTGRVTVLVHDPSGVRAA